MVRTRVFGVLLSIVLLAGALASPAAAASPSGRAASNCDRDRQGGSCELTKAQREALMAIARDTWPFFDADTDPPTHLPMDNIGFRGAPAKGHYTSPTNIGMYFWGVVAARDLHFIDHQGALDRASATLAAVEKLEKWHGFLFSW